MHFSNNEYALFCLFDCCFVTRTVTVYFIICCISLCWVKNYLIKMINQFIYNYFAFLWIELKTHWSIFCVKISGFFSALCLSGISQQKLKYIDYLMMHAYFNIQILPILHHRISFSSYLFDAEFHCIIWLLHFKSLHFESNNIYGTSLDSLFVIV